MRTEARKFIIFMTLSLLHLCCAQPEKEEGMGQCEIAGEIDVFAGRNRILIRWEGVNNGEYDLRFVVASDKVIDVYAQRSGQEYVEGLSEGTVDVSVQLLDGGVRIAELPKSVMVLGDRYEAGLKRWETDDYSFEDGTLKCRMSRSAFGGLYGEEFSYTDADGSEKTTLLMYDDTRQFHEIHIDNIKAGLKRRTVYMPEPEVGDKFYTAYEEMDERIDVPMENVVETVDGYRGIWFDLGQATAYGSKYCGGLGTYTMKHIPMAIYSKESDRTFFVYGGTPAEDKKYLQCMIGCYDHSTGMLQKPRVVMDKGVDGVNDPHDDPTVQLDKDGYVWVFVSGRSTKRDGRVYRSMRPYDITAFEMVSEFEMAYPQIMYNEDKGFFFFFTKYAGKRRLYYQSSIDGRTWTSTKNLANIKAGQSNSGHYQISNICGTKLCTAFNRHKNGDVDTRTSIYYVQSTDWGQTWTTASGEPVTVPVTERESNALVMDYETLGKNCYIKDLNFDTSGNPIVLYVISDNHKTGPEGGKREWHTMHWDGTKWNVTKFAESTHCYDSGSIWVDGDIWTIIAPTDPSKDSALYWGAGGELQQWLSTDKGETWTMTKQMTSNSGTNHTYVRRPFHADEGFWAYWADGRTDRFSRSNLYFCTKDGQIYRMPYNMTAEWQAPEKYN